VAEGGRLENDRVMSLAGSNPASSANNDDDIHRESRTDRSDDRAEIDQAIGTLDVAGDEP
jgi:hypothetical protein